LLVRCTDEAAPFPRPVILELACDGAAHGMFPDHQTFADPDGFIAQHSAAIASGWTERQGPQGRTWIGRCCTGKGARDVPV
jgi:hypothetical protein